MLVQSIQLLEYQMVRALCRFDINLVQTVAPGWRQIESEMALDLITIPAVSALAHAGSLRCSLAHKVIALLATSWTSGHSLSKPVSEE